MSKLERKLTLNKPNTKDEPKVMTFRSSKQSRCKEKICDRKDKDIDNDNGC